ncbi:MAG TPA: PEP-CTERM sorting domain-containing protein [Sedimentisphaerales bacterium]|nr:PEP-CTERM sorting domain-containing protein [Sedimentisphaerales bacterium]
MKTMIVSIIAACFCATSFCAKPAEATLITIAIEAVVDGVHDPDNDLEGLVNVGDLITGTYTYDTDTPDMDWLWGSESDIVARYHYFNPPYGISLSVGGVDFKTDPANTSFLIEIVNDGSDDFYLVRSYNNLPLANGTSVNNIVWYLNDNYEDALQSTDLPITAPILDDWAHNVLNVEGPGTRDNILFQAHVTSAVLIPEPGTILLLGIGAIALVRKVKK